MNEYTSNDRQHLSEDDVISAGEAKWFRKQLVKIAGKNPHGKPNLQMVWGVTHTDPMQIGDYIKYEDFREDDKQYGERRWIIEIWRSPEFLAKSGRYQETKDPDTGETLLREVSPEGCYDYWLRLERANFTYHPPDNEALEVIKALWEWESLPQNQRDALEQADRERERREMIAAQRKQENDLWGFDPADYSLIQTPDGHQRLVRKLIEV